MSQPRLGTDLADFLRGDDGIPKAAPQEGDEPDLSDEDAVSLNIDPFNDEYTGIDFPPPGTSGAATKVPGLPEGSWSFPPLYKVDSQGNTLRWQIGYNAVTKKLLWTVGRLETGNLQLFTTDVIPTKAQKGSFEVKAYQSAVQRIELKLKNGFLAELGGHSELPIPLPMLANKYHPPTEGSIGNVPEFPVQLTPKIDGIRGMIFLNNKRPPQTIIYTRMMNPRNYFDHVREEAGRLLEFLPPGCILDGELFSPTVPFQVISSIAGSELEKHPNEKDLDYYIFDVYHPETVWKNPKNRGEGTKAARTRYAGQGDSEYVYMRPTGFTIEDYTGVTASEFTELPQDDPVEVASRGPCQGYDDILAGGPLWTVEVRIALVLNSFKCYRAKYGEWPHHVKLVKSFIVYKRSDVDKLFKDMLELGLEGVMIRQLSRTGMDPLRSLYRPGRSDNLLKVKEMNTTEVIVTGVKPGRGKAKDLAVLTYREPGSSVSGTVVPASTHEQRREWLLHPELVKGRVLIVSYQNRMASGALRFPVGVAFVEGAQAEIIKVTPSHTKQVKKLSPKRRPRVPK